LSFFVRVKGLEPSHLAAPDPKSGVSTNFTTPASNGVQIYKLCLLLQKNFVYFFKFIEVR
jgi:hypothetical protein